MDRADGTRLSVSFRQRVETPCYKMFGPPALEAMFVPSDTIVAVNPRYLLIAQASVIPYFCFLSTGKDKRGLTNNRRQVREEQVVNKYSADPFDVLIYKKGLRIKNTIADKKLNTILILLNNGEPLTVPINYFDHLNTATQSELNNWELSGNGTGLRWKDLDEDLSLKGLIKESALLGILNRLECKNVKHSLTVL